MASPAFVADQAGSIGMPGFARVECEGRSIASSFVCLKRWAYNRRHRWLSAWTIDRSSQPTSAGYGMKRASPKKFWPMRLG